MFEVLNSRKELRERLLALINKNPQSITELSKKMSISSLTLKSFLIDDKETDFKRLCMIKNYVEQREKENEVTEEK